MANECSNCRFCRTEDRGITCHYNPPAVVTTYSAEHGNTPIQLTGQDGKPAWGSVYAVSRVSTFPMTIWPNVLPTSWCGKYETIPDEELTKVALEKE